MTTPKGWFSQQKDERTKSEFATISQIGPNKYGLDVSVSMYHQLVSDGDLIDAVTTEDNGDVYQITVNTHGAKSGDLIYFKTGSLVNRQVRVLETPDANTIVFAETFQSGSAQPAPGDEIDILSPIQPRTNAEGDLVVSPGAISFILDGSPQEVTEDTGTPANNKPLPVKITGLDGDVVINSSNLNLAVQLDHNSANPDSVQLGDGTEIAAINASNELQVADDTARTTLSTIDGKLIQNIQTAANSLAVVLASSQEAILTSIDSSLNSIEAEDFATEATLTLVNNKLPAGQTNNVNSLGVSLSTEQEAFLSTIAGDTTSLDGKDFATQATLAAVLADLQLKADLTETQPVSAASLPLPTGAATEATLAALAAEDFATETTLAAINAKFGTLGQKASSGSAPVVLSTAQETILSNIDTSLNAIEAATGAGLDIVDQIDVAVGPLVDVSSNNIPTGSFLEIVASTAAEVKKITVVEDIGEFIGIYTGAAASEALKAILPLGGGEVELNIPAATRVTLSSLTGSTITAGSIGINFQG